MSIRTPGRITRADLPSTGYRIRLPSLRPRARALRPAAVFVYSFAALIMLGSVALMLPVSSREGRWTPFADALFTATSAVCVTGMTIVDTGTYWSGVGQVVILLLIQVGGVGFMTSSTSLLLVAGRAATLRQRVLLSEAIGESELGGVLRLTRHVIIFTLITEVIGAVLLTLRFLPEVDAPLAIWWGVFHAVSAFNNAGFDVLGDGQSIVPFQRDLTILSALGVLAFLGSLSYTAVADFVRHRSFKPLALDTKLVLVTTLVVLILGTLGLLFTERRNVDTLGGMDAPVRLLNAIFLTINRTAGFSSIDMKQLTEEGLFLLSGLMFIGGSAGSTAGGIKVQTFGILLFAVISTARGLDDIVAFRRRIPTEQVLRALSVLLLFLLVLFLIGFTLSVVEPFVFHRVMFDSVSALGTVGYSTGITAEMSPAGRAILIVAMFVGRLGPLTLVLALAARSRRTRLEWPREPIKLG